VIDKNIIVIVLTELHLAQYSSVFT